MEADQMEAHADAALRNWFYNQVSTAASLLTWQADRLVALLAATQAKDWAYAFQTVAAARHTLEDAAAATDDAAALDLSDAANASPPGYRIPGRAPWSQYLHDGAWGGGQLARPHVAKALEHARRAVDALTQCAVLVRCMVVNYFTDGAADKVAEAFVLNDARIARELLDAAVGYLREAAASTVNARCAVADSFL